MKQYSEAEINAYDNELFECYFPEDVNSYSFKCEFGDRNTIMGTRKARVFLLKDARLYVVEDAKILIGEKLPPKSYSYDLKNVEMTLASNADDKSIVISDTISMRNIKHFKRTIQLFGAVLRRNGLVESNVFSSLELQLLAESKEIKEPLDEDERGS